MKKGKLIMLTALTAILMTVGAWTPMAEQAEASNTVTAKGDIQENSFPPTILPPI